MLVKSKSLRNKITNKMKIWKIENAININKDNDKVLPSEYFFSWIILLSKLKNLIKNY